jgi:hypothetical protein
MGGAMSAFMRKRPQVQGAAPYPGNPGVNRPNNPDVTGQRGQPQVPSGFDPNYHPRNGGGVLGGLGIDPQQWVWGQQRRGMYGGTGMDELQRLADVRNSINSGMEMGRGRLGGGAGAGFGAAPSDLIRRLLEGQMGGGGGF